MGDVTTLDTARLRLMPYSPDQLLALIEEPDRFETLVGFPLTDGLHGFMTSDQVSPVWLAALRASRGGAPDPWVYGFAVVHREARLVIGGASFKGPPDEAGMVEIAYGIAPEFQGRGLATEAAVALLELAYASGG